MDDDAESRNRSTHGKHSLNTLAGALAATTAAGRRPWPLSEKMKISFVSCFTGVCSGRTLLFGAVFLFILFYFVALSCRFLHTLAVSISGGHQTWPASHPLKEGRPGPLSL